MPQPKDGYNAVVAIVTNAAGMDIYNGLIHQDLGGQNVGYMHCDATVHITRQHTPGVKVGATGRYRSHKYLHAEMDALAQYAATGKAFNRISRIDITSPPCRCCAFVLSLHGLLPLVHTNGAINTFPPGGSWKWPDELKDPARFANNALYQRVLTGFGIQPNAAGVGDAIGHMASAIQNRTPMY